MKKIVITLIVAFSFQLFAQDTNTIKFLPLSVGNTWVYYYTTSNFAGNGSGYEIFSITGTIQQNGKTYYSYSHRIINITGNYGCAPAVFSGEPVRVDSFSCNIYKAMACGSRTETLIDSLHSMLRDTALTCLMPTASKDVCTDTSAYSLFGSPVPSITFANSFFEGINIQKYAKNIGVVYHYYNLVQSTCSTLLRGCIINGHLYGDTSIVLGLHQISSEIPKQFSLYQNYPNPFNPTTNIKFSVPQKSFIIITIYDILGKEVSKLVNEEFSPGTYETNWPARTGGDAANYPSGVYYYQFTAKPSDRSERSDGYSETKKMVFVK